MGVWSTTMKTFGQIKEWCLVGMIMGRIKVSSSKSQHVWSRTGLNQILLPIQVFTLPTLIPAHPLDFWIFH